MKLSLSWIFEHLQNSWHDIDIDELVNRFTVTTAEVDFYTKISFDLEECALGVVTDVKPGCVTLHVPEWKKEVELERSDCVLGMSYLIKKNKQGYRFATMKDFHADKDGYLPPFFCTEDKLNGDWKKSCLNEDYVITIDNKSISHRADLWGHRGVAREVAAMFDYDLIPEDQLVKQFIIKNYGNHVRSSANNPIAIDIAVPQACDRFAAVYLKAVGFKASLPSVSQKLSSVNARSINALVDATNYVMYDIGQPLHAFDAEKIKHNIVVRCAREGEKINVLDETSLVLTHQDCVVADEQGPLALAGIMGGIDSGVTEKTQAMLVESAHFDPVVIRRSSINHKKRTEASTRFEKGLDPHANTIALTRFLFLLDKWDIHYSTSNEIISLGAVVQEPSITVSHDYISKKIGIPISPDSVVEILTGLGFGAQENVEGQNVIYTITVPTYRLGSVTIKEDIVEEVVRYIGYGSIPFQIPQRLMKPVEQQTVQHIKQIKRHCAYSLSMHEISTYPLYDEQFLKVLGWEPTDAVALRNPVSEHWFRLVTSLIPHMLKAVYENKSLGQPFRFFEWGRIWHQEGDKPVEKKSFVALWYQPDKEINFYDVKADIESLGDAIGLPFDWKPCASESSEWIHPYQSAYLINGNELVGHMGRILPFVLQKLTQGDAYVLVLEGSILEKYKKPVMTFSPLPRYPRTFLDISMFVPASVTVAELEHAIASADTRIVEVFLLDYYNKTEEDRRSVTIRYIVYDDTKTLTKEEVDQVASEVKKTVLNYGASIR